MTDGDNMMDMFDGDNGGGDAIAAAPAPAASAGELGLLDLDDIFGGGGAAPAPPPPAAAQNGSVSAKAEPKPVAAGGQSDVDLLSDIFSAPPAMAAAPVAAPTGGGFDIFAQPAVVAAAPAAAPIGADLFAQPAPTAMMAPTMSANDPFGASPPAAPPSAVPAPTVPAPPSVAVGGPAPSETSVRGFSHGGLSVDFACTKPDAWNKQHSVLVARFVNSNDAPLYGLHLQVAVPKYVTMEMKPPTSTTVPVSGGNKGGVTQTISVTNTMLGTKNLMLKVKASFTLKGSKVEHTTTCSGFPAGQY
mmetsp:Transcript_38219/g.92192  ORF Transcript_38219/g.92192 Transcript_38219/m.92192 type:complete len:303 (+) Transcript_38219:412-1320(+)